MSGAGGDAAETGGAPTVSTGGAVSETGGTVATGGSGGGPTEPARTLLWSQTFTGEKALTNTVKTSATRSLGWMTGSGDCPTGWGPDPLPNDFTGTITVEVPAECPGIYRFADGGNIYYSAGIYGPSIYTDPDPGGPAGNVAVLTVRKLHWDNNPSRYEWDYTWEFYYVESPR